MVVGETHHFRKHPYVCREGPTHPSLGWPETPIAQADSWGFQEIQVLYKFLFLFHFTSNRMVGKGSAKLQQNYNSILGGHLS